MMSGVVSVPVIPPFPWRPLLAYLAHRSTPVLETVTTDRYVRRTAAGNVSVEYDSTAQALRCSMQGGDGTPDFLPRIRRLFDTLHDPEPVHRALAGCPIIGARVRGLPGVRVAGCWEPFELCLRVILGQQVSVKAAHRLMGRLVARCPALEAAALEASAVAAADLSALGLTAARARTLRTFAERVAGRDVRLDAPSWEETAGQLQEVPGFGPWTLQYLAIRLGRDADAFPDTDLGLLRATGIATPRELRRLAENWRPYRAYAAMYLWACGRAARESTPADSPTAPASGRPPSSR